MNTGVEIVAQSVITPLGVDRDFYDALWRAETSIRPDTRTGGPSPASFFDTPRTPNDLVREALTGVLGNHPKPDLTILATTKGRTHEALAGNINPHEIYHIIPTEFATPHDLVVSNACTSGALAVIEACEILNAHQADRVAVVACDVLTPFVTEGFGSLNALSAKPCTPFDRDRDGLNLGEAAAAIVLRRSVGTGPRIVATGASNDATHISAPARDAKGLIRAVQRCLGTRAPSYVGAICAHATGTVYNDAMEATAFHHLFDPPPPVFAIKGAIGHTLGAAGLIEVVVSSEALTRGLPPTAGFQNAEDERPLNVTQTASGDPVANVLTTNSGFGGMNTSLLIARGDA